MFKRGFGIVYILFVILLVGCSGEEKDQTSEKEIQEKEENVTTTEEKEIEKEDSLLDKLASIKVIDSRETMKVQQAGILVEDISIEDEMAEPSNGNLDANLIEDFIINIQELTKETQDSDDIYQAFTYLLGSPHYKDTIEKAESFEPNFDEPFLPEPGKTEEEITNEPEQGKAIILLDASSSMLLTVDNRLKMDIAKEAVERFGETIGQDNDISLVVYGHKGSESAADKELSCTGIEEVYPMAAYNKEGFEQSLTTFESKGYTPLAGAIQKAAEMSKEFEDAVTVYIVSDGVETCDGDPVKEAETFVKDNDNRTVNIIGFNVDQSAEEQLKLVSSAGNGEYYAANNADELKTTIEKQWLPSFMDLAWAFTMAPDGWETMAEYERFDEELEQIKSIISNERQRYIEALNVLKAEELLSDELESEISQLISERYNVKIDLMRDFRSEKIDEINGRAREIRERVDEWTEKMRKLKEERGDTIF